jgi:hypothetical protein
LLEVYRGVMCHHNRPDIRLKSAVGRPGLKHNRYAIHLWVSRRIQREPGTSSFREGI